LPRRVFLAIAFSSEVGTGSREENASTEGKIPRRFAMIYGGFEIQSFEAGRGLWHARIQRADQEPVVIDGLSFPTLEVGFAWSDPETAIADAIAHIDRFKSRFAAAS
jgi:hypothetical protein